MLDPLVTAVDSTQSSQTSSECLTQVLATITKALGTFAWCVRSARAAPFRTRSLRAAILTSRLPPFCSLDKAALLVGRRTGHRFVPETVSYRRPARRSRPGACAAHQQHGGARCRPRLMALSRPAAWPRQRPMCGWLESACGDVGGCADPVTADGEPPDAWPSTTGRTAACLTSQPYHVLTTFDAGELMGGALLAEESHDKKHHAPLCGLMAAHVLLLLTPDPKRCSKNIRYSEI